MYKLLRNVIASQVLTEKSYSKLVAVLTRHFNPRLLRSSSNQVPQLSESPGESVTAFIAELQAQAVHCKFGNQEAAEGMLQDRIVCGINEHAIQQRMCTTPNECDMLSHYNLM